MSMSDIQRQVQSLPYGEYVVIATVDHNSWNEASRQLAFRFPDMRKSENRMTLSFDGDKTELVAAMNHVFGITSLRSYNKNTELANAVAALRSVRWDQPSF